MRDPYGRGRRVYPLPPFSSGPKDVDADILLFDLNFYVFFDFRDDFYRSKRGVPAFIGVKRRNADQAMHAVFGFQITVGKISLDQQRDIFNPRFFPRKNIDDLYFVLLILSPAAVHPKKHGDPIAGFRAAGTRVDAEDG